MHTNGAASGGGGGDFNLSPDDVSNLTTATNGVLKTVGFIIDAGAASSFAAALIDKPPASSLNSGSLTVVDADPVNPDVTFTPDALGRFVIGLTATDADSNESEAVTVVQVAPDPPRLTAPSSTAGGVDGALVTVVFTNDGGGVASTSATLTKPAGSSATLSHTTPSLSASYTPDVPGNYSVSMTGTNSDGSSPAVQAARSVESRAPTASAGANQAGVAAGTINLDGSGSAVHGSSGGSLTYLWAFTSDDTATLSSTTAQSPTFTGALDEAYVLRLTVTDTETGESATDDVIVAMQATPMPAASAVCDFLTDTTDKTSWAGAGTYDIFEDDGTTVKSTAYYNAGGNSDGSDVFEITEADGVHLRVRWSGSGASINRRLVVEPTFPGATLDWSGRIIVALLFSELTVEGSGASNPATIRVNVGPASTSVDYNSAGMIGATVTNTGASTEWEATAYHTTTATDSAAATGSFTTDPAGGTCLMVFAFDAAANIRVALGETEIPDDIGSVAYDFESAARATSNPTTGAANPWADSGGGVAVAVYTTNKSTATPGETIAKLSKIKVWTD